MIKLFYIIKPKCGNCDNCLDAPGVTDATELARKLLSAVYRTGQSFGMGHLTKVLTGSPDDRIRQRGHDNLSVFGIVSGEEAVLLKPVARALQAHGHLVANDHGGLALGAGAREILKGEREVAIVVPQKRERRSGRRGGDGTRFDQPDVCSGARVRISSGHHS